MNVLAIDIGAYVIKGAIVNAEAGELVSDRYRTPAPEDNSPHRLMSKIHEIVRFFKWKGPLGVAIPSVVSEGTVVEPVHLNESWMDARAETLLEELTDCPVSILNDADAAGIAEMTFGAGRDYNGLVIILTIGTGIGSSIFFNGMLIPNSELGKLEIRGVPASHSASRKARKEEGLKKKMWARRVQTVLEAYEAMFHPELFILGGWISKKTVKILPYIDTHTPVVGAELLNEAGLVGAACFAQREINIGKKIVTDDAPEADD